MRDLARRVAETWLEQRKQLEYPLLKESQASRVKSQAVSSRTPSTFPGQAAGFVLEIGVEELPASDLDSAISQLKVNAPGLLADLHLEHGTVTVLGTPRRLAVLVDSLAPRQPDRSDLVKGPSADRAFGADGAPTPAAIGFARSKGVQPKDLEVRELVGGRYVVATVNQAGRPTSEVLIESLPGLVAGIKFDKSMRWLPGSLAAGNGGAVTFSRPIRWLVALLGESILPFEYAGLTAGRTSRGLRPHNSPEIEIPGADKYLKIIRKNGILLDFEERKALIEAGSRELAASVKGQIILPPELLAEVASLVEKPAPFLGNFEKEFISLPGDVLISVMKKHQRYFPIERPIPGTEGAATQGKHPTLLPYFVAVRNGDSVGLDLVRQGNEHVIRARFADANFFVGEDLKHKLEDFRPRLGTLMFQI
jgi:glycyl-tRNA synthetase